ncbi:hypothetical protein L3V43_22580 [Pseudoalteromonas sp. L23]|uniref:hypothetical protein n=1 Tax=unclassified Pseudoalteromonas TaxID=194690 RepID=UPI001F2478A5|nr:MULTISPECIES: hypothetical protein [unclassified Pseudoalteromonas]MCF2828622.1 hypothetical protein [Pseudoalteromonas sp. OF5H-5]MCF2832576.1 hypothetical protein [Pseudoalteromonas sp. DL2-H6]MCF2924774.1 hypothetical protein [Pseudoalteromonas sp. DL2-H1]MCF7516388.1 hypothetical protein [Pseudoalteromonas sp. L7]MCF7528435.1 hypothetical protein [Pseudoalteromonas sp. L23]
MLIIYRISIINWLQSTTSIRLPLFNNDNMAKEQGAITHIYFAVAALCFAMILEHVVRHPDLVHLPSDWAIQTQLIYDSYPIIVNVYTYILLIVLFIMTIDGWAIRKMRAMEEKSNAKKRLD